MGSIQANSNTPKKRGAPTVDHRYQWTPSRDAIVKDCYSVKHKRPPLTKAAEKLGLSKKCVMDRAILLGVKKPSQGRSCPWSAEEKALLEKYAHTTHQTIWRHFRKAGFNRTAAAIEIYRKRYIGSKENLRINNDCLSSSQLADVFHVRRETIAMWARKGWLKGNLLEGSGRENGVWLFAIKSIREFVINYTAHVDFTRVDKFWLIDVLCPNKGGKQQNHLGAYDK